MTRTPHTSAQPPALRLLRFSSIMSTAVAMTAAVAHLMELPAKRRLEPPLYVRLHRTLYWNFAAAAGSLTAAHGAFWAIVSPVNAEMLRWRPEAIPADWATARDRWEFGHAARACLLTGAFAALAWSLVDRSDDRAAARASADVISASRL
jgi:hypothetical protein